MKDSDTIDMVDAIAQLAMEVNGSELDWGMLAVEEESAYKLMASSALENAGLDDPIIARSVVTALLVENFMLNIKLLQANKK